MTRINIMLEDLMANIITNVYSEKLNIKFVSVRNE